VRGPRGHPPQRHRGPGKKLKRNPRRLFAYRLAARAGILNVNGLLDSIRPEQMDEWLAYRRIEADPDERLRRILITGLMAIAAGVGVKLSPEDLDPMLGQRDEELSGDQLALILSGGQSRIPNP
jgi:hypothetical protein